MHYACLFICLCNGMNLYAYLLVCACNRITVYMHVYLRTCVRGCVRACACVIARLVLSHSTHSSKSGDRFLMAPFTVTQGRAKSLKLATWSTNPVEVILSGPRIISSTNASQERPDRCSATFAARV